MVSSTETGQPAGSCYIVPARTFRGSRAEILAEIEDAVRALMALRLVILAEVPPLHSSSPVKR
jgi:hypothetical protein